MKPVKPLKETKNRIPRDIYIRRFPISWRWRLALFQTCAKRSRLFGFPRSHRSITFDRDASVVTAIKIRCAFARIFALAVEHPLPKRCKSLPVTNTRLDDDPNFKELKIKMNLCTYAISPPLTVFAWFCGSFSRTPIKLSATIVHQNG